MEFRGWRNLASKVMPLWSRSHSRYVSETERLVAISGAIKCCSLALTELCQFTLSNYETTSRQRPDGYRNRWLCSTSKRLRYQLSNTGLDRRPSDMYLDEI